MINRKRFNTYMHAVDDGLLEEAQQTRAKKRIWLPIAAVAAACVCVVTAVSLLIPNQQTTQIPNPIRSATVAELEELGYTLPIPMGAENAEYTLIDMGEKDSTPMAQATFTENGQEYTCRALKTQQAKDISGIYEMWTESLDWTVGALDMQLRGKDGNAWVGWYSVDDGTQWCLSGADGDSLSLLHTAQAIVETLGYDLTVAPEGAENVAYNAFALDGLTVGETTFDLGGVHYSYRTASTPDVSDDFADISGVDTEYANSASGEVQWCPARIYYDEGGSGKIVWFDVVPGLLYSISMDSGASENALLDMAQQLFVPAQGDVG